MADEYAVVVQVGGLVEVAVPVGGKHERGNLVGKFAGYGAASFGLDGIAAKKVRDFADAARSIRKELLDAGIVFDDTPQGTSWRRAWVSLSCCRIRRPSE